MHRLWDNALSFVTGVTSVVIQIFIFCGKLDNYNKLINEIESC